MNKGLLKSGVYYLAGFILAWLSYLIFGHQYKHAPGAYHIVILLTFLGGLFWLIAAVLKYFFGIRSPDLKWIIGAHLMMCVCFAAFLIWISYSGDTEVEQIPDQVIVETSGDTTMIYNRGSVVYYKVRDSVLIDFIDSTKVDWSKTVYKKKH